MSKHTPGEWIALHRKAGQIVGKHFEITTLNKSGAAELVIAIVPIEDEANAALISAAPDLLAALETLERLAGSGCMEDDPARRAARSAIAKATGAA